MLPDDDERARRNRAHQELERLFAEADERAALRAPRTEFPAEAAGPHPLRAPQAGTRRPFNPVALGLSITAVLVLMASSFPPVSSFHSIRMWTGLHSFSFLQTSEPTGPHAFLRSQARTGAPVGFPPCTPIQVVVNPNGAPRHYEKLVDDSLEDISRASGLTFERIGETEAITASPDPSGAPTPVVIAWLTPEQEPRLAGNVLGLAGPISAGSPGALRHITGAVALNREYFENLPWHQWHRARSVVVHELGHVVGLDHVPDTAQIMHAHASTALTLGDGDREGLARLGEVAC